MKTIQLLLFTLLLFQSFNFQAQCLNVQVQSVNDCYNSGHGTGQFTINNGIAPYHYDWGTGTTTTNATTHTITGLYAGNYTVSIEDNLGCDTVVNFTVSAMASLDSAFIDPALDPFGIGHCINASPSVLNSVAYIGAPLPGVFSGPGVRNSLMGPNVTRFYPDSAVIDMGHTGNVTITYTYPTTTNCIMETKFTTKVHALPDLEFANLPDSLCPDDDRIQLLVLNHVVTGSSGQISYTNPLGNQTGSFSITNANGTPIPNFLTLFDSLNPAVALGHSVIYVSYSHTVDATLGSCSNTIYDSIMVVDCCVWPGDTDNDGIANNFDILPIGLHHSTTGSGRIDSGIDWNCKASNDWGVGSFGNPTVDIKHIDSDGNALINSIDTNAIILNWSQTHLKSSSTSTSSSTALPLYLDSITAYPNDTILLNVQLGNNLVPGYGYGIAFSILYDIQGIDTNNIVVSFDNSWLGNINSDMIGIYKNFYTQGLVEVGLTRIDHQGAYGSGPIAQVQFIIKDDVLPKSAYTRLDFNISNVRLIDSVGTEIPVTGLPSQVLVLDLNSHTTLIQEMGEDIKVYPNPTAGKICVESKESPIQSTKLYTTTGQLVYESTHSNTFKELIAVENLPSGLYILHINTGQQFRTISVVKR